MKKKLILLCLFSLIFVSGCSNKLFSNKPSVEQIRSICNLATVEAYYHNVAKSTKKAGDGFASFGEKDRRFWIQYTGIAKIGIDMTKVKMTIKDDKVKVYLPNASVLSIDVNEKELDKNSYIREEDAFFNKNPITAKDESNAIYDAQLNMKMSTLKNTNLLLSAQTRAKNLIENYINKMGDISGIEYKIEWEYENIENIQKEIKELQKEIDNLKKQHSKK